MTERRTVQSNEYLQSSCVWCVWGNNDEKERKGIKSKTKMIDCTQC